MTTRVPEVVVLFEATERTPFTVFVAEDPRDIERAQALRYDAFSTEMGAPLPNAVHSERLGRLIDVDRFDRCSAHLLVRHDPTDEIVGCYRIVLPAPRGEREVFTTSMFHLNEEFDALADEVAVWGRATIAADYRGGVVSVLLRLALLLFYERAGFRYAMGCMSVRMEDGVHPRAALVRAALGFVVDNDAFGHGELRVEPIRPVVVDGVDLQDLPRPEGADEDLVAHDPGLGALRRRDLRHALVRSRLRDGRLPGPVRLRADAARGHARRGPLVARGAVITRLTRTVLLAAVLLLAVLGALGSGVGGALKSGGSTDPRAESARAQTVLDEDFHRGGSSLVLSLRAETPEAAAAAADYGRAVTEVLRGLPTVQSAMSAWTDPAAAARLTSSDGRTGLVVASVSGGSGEAPDNAARSSTACPARPTG